ncbi:dihydrofolate reductase [Catenulispora sp. MAP5-51]|uniref:dihydrofolate reductase family protein n=1 Tax=Catenulispora sp. MAP5-51 TaxID=3156298 RepID=UPI003516C004
MRKLVAFEHMTVDGYAASNEGLGFEFTWRAYSEELSAYGDEHIRADVDTALYGRATYLGMREYWSAVPADPAASQHEQVHAEWVNGVEKIVFSTTLESAGWTNARVIGSDVEAQVRALKAGPGGTMQIYASPKLVHSFVGLGLIDEFRIVLHPGTLGAGTPLFPDKSALDLDLVESKAFASGAVYLRYRVA